MANAALGPLIGGSFAPPIKKAELDNYAECAKKVGGEVGEWMSKLLNLCVQHQKLTPAKAGSEVHKVGIGRIARLSPETLKALDTHQPWKRELQMLSNSKDDGLFDTIEDKEVKNAAMHLLWYAWELELEREPLTNDQLG